METFFHRRGECLGFLTWFEKDLETLREHMDRLGEFEDFIRSSPSSAIWLSMVPSSFCRSVLTRAYNANRFIYLESIPEDRRPVESDGVDNG
jgi:hypothetical protein